MVEYLYEEISQCLLGFCPDNWGDVRLKTAVLDSRCGGFEIVVTGQSGGRLDPKIDWKAIKRLGVIFRELRDDLLKSDGQRVWGVEVFLERSGKFKIEYSYDRPSWYSEDEEEVSLNGNERNSLDIRVVGDTTEHGAASSDSDMALAWLRAATLKHSTQWGLGKEANWNLDLNAGQLRWTFSDGRIVHADIQVIGTFNTKNDSFLWGWDHPSVPQPLRRAAIAAQAWGEANGVADFTIRNPHCSEDRTWVFAAVAAQQDGASGVYRGNANGTWVYVAFSEPGVEPSSEA